MVGLRAAGASLFVCVCLCATNLRKPLLSDMFKTVAGSKPAPEQQGSARGFLKMQINQRFPKNALTKGTCRQIVFSKPAQALCSCRSYIELLAGL